MIEAALKQVSCFVPRLPAFSTGGQRGAGRAEVSDRVATTGVPPPATERRAKLGGMSTRHDLQVETFTPHERDYIRQELDMFFSTYPTVAEGFHLKTWRGGPMR